MFKKKENKEIAPTPTPAEQSTPVTQVATAQIADPKAPAAMAPTVPVTPNVTQVPNNEPVAPNIQNVQPIMPADQNIAAPINNQAPIAPVMPQEQPTTANVSMGINTTNMLENNPFMESQTTPTFDQTPQAPVEATAPNFDNIFNATPADLIQQPAPTPVDNSNMVAPTPAVHEPLPKETINESGTIAPIIDPSLTPEESSNLDFERQNATDIIPAVEDTAALIDNPKPIVEQQIALKVKPEEIFEGGQNKEDEITNIVGNTIKEEEQELPTMTPNQPPENIVPAPEEQITITATPTEEQTTSPIVEPVSIPVENPSVNEMASEVTTNENSIQPELNTVAEPAIPVEQPTPTPIEEPTIQTDSTNQDVIAPSGNNVVESTPNSAESSSQSFELPNSVVEPVAITPANTEDGISQTEIPSSTSPEITNISSENTANIATSPQTNSPITPTSPEIPVEVSPAPNQENSTTNTEESVHRIIEPVTPVEKASTIVQPESTPIIEAPVVGMPEEPVQSATNTTPVNEEVSPVASVTEVPTEPVAAAGTQPVTEEPATNIIAPATPNVENNVNIENSSINSTPEPALSSTSTNEPVHKTRFCDNCGAMITDDSTLCPSCGATIN